VEYREHAAENGPEVELVSYGKMNTQIDIISTAPVKDSEGFITEGDHLLASVRAYKEDRHANEKWASMAAFSEATALFRLRVIPGVPVTSEMVIACDDGRFEILSVENVKGRACTEVMAKKVCQWLRWI
jgi:head-tail adaptor